MISTVKSLPEPKAKLVGAHEDQLPVVVVAIDPGSQKYGFATLLVSDLRGDNRELISCGANSVSRYNELVTGYYASGKRKGQPKKRKEKMLHPQFLARLQKNMASLIWRLRILQGVQYIFAIEQMFVGVNPHGQMTLLKAVGAIEAAAGEFAWAGYYNPPPGTWKKSAIGSGSADKDKTWARMLETYPELRDREYFPSFYEYDDVADALGIATAAAYSLPEILGILR